jgi:hypothetical protein
MFVCFVGIKKWAVYISAAENYCVLVESNVCINHVDPALGKTPVVSRYSNGHNRMGANLLRAKYNILPTCL